MFEVEITTPKAVALNLMLANGKSIAVPPNGSSRFLLTGDELGRVEATLDHGRRAAKREGAMDSEVVGGGIKVLTPGYGEVPKGSKKALMAAEEEKEARKAKK